MDITRGSLDDITRPARNSRYRPGSRVSLNSPVNRSLSVASSSLELLPPDPDILLQEDNDLAVVEFLNSSEDEEVGNGEEEDINDFGRSGGVFNACRVQDRLHNLDLLLLAKGDNESMDGSLPDTDDPSNLRELTHLNRTDEDRSGRSSSRGRRSENRESRQDVEEEEEEEDPDADLAAITDPELKKAIKKMRKLDRILNTRVTREKEVKRQRKMLHYQLEVELEAIKEEGGGKSKEASENTTRFLALVPPVSHDEGVNMEDIPSTPVFATQPPEGSSPSHKTSSSSEHSSPGRTVGQSRRASKTSPRDHLRRPRPPGASNQGRKEDEPDFIHRNIQLASDAGNLIAMTDDEKKRLEDMLSEVVVLAGEPDEGSSGNSLQLKHIPGSGYTPDADSQMLLQDIDEKLKNLLPSDDFMDICSTPSMLGDRRESFNPAAFDLGERILKDTKIEQSQQQRLKNIEQELVSLQNQVDNEISSPSLSKAQLNSLLQRCSDASDRTLTEITSPRLQQTPSTLQSNQSSPRASSQQASPRLPGQGGSQMSSGAPPGGKLSNDALQQLLSEAKASLGLLAIENADSSRASSRTTTTMMTGRDSASQLAFSMDDSPRSEMSMNTSRTLVSHDVIQQLLKNPRATLLQSSRLQNMENDEEREIDDDDEREFDDDELNASLDI
ncbi:fibrous sheath-interacting protein 1 [Strongylocentrotus purpuratus]|uniref:Fibrous sheath-interacting protein 1 n=1 Tax=Strongylocentrotus purpuratus TaxID=7668 RepID=A0A7M7RDS3_STRPU|nr:fibrous sheath-interacting protein 1 [Strongylocentrotus purpuratus]|eukprot:XP_785087.2 PREDICTED: fibrous sheath-interacting protein 1 [Strongylocentrotus purpuratus]